MKVKLIYSDGTVEKHWQYSPSCCDLESMANWMFRAKWRIYSYRRNWDTVVFRMKSGTSIHVNDIYIKLEAPLTDAEARWLFLTNAHTDVAPTALQLLNDPNPLLPTLAAEIGSLASDTTSTEGDNTLGS